MNIKNKNAFLIGNAGLGDSMVLSGMANYLATLYDNVFFATTIEFYEQVKLFFSNPKIIVYPINKDFKSHMFEFSKIMHDFQDIFDIYALGHYGALKIDHETYKKTLYDGTVKTIITNYPTSYYADVNIPLEYMTKYFMVSYPQNILTIYNELLENYSIYRVVHQQGSNASINIVKHQNLNIDDVLTIDVNKNLYDKGHKFYDICDKFVNLPSVIYYTKLLENASELYLMDSCIHALALVVDINKATPRICYMRSSQFDYGIPNKFKYYKLIFQLDQ